MKGEQCISVLVLEVVACLCHGHSYVIRIAALQVQKHFSHIVTLDVLTLIICLYEKVRTNYFFCNWCK